MDAWFWLVVTIAIVFAITTWLMWGKAFSLQTDLDVAEGEIAKAHATIDRLKRELDGSVVRGRRGQFARRVTVTVPDVAALTVTTPPRVWVLPPPERCEGCSNRE